jgi:hypothetical protein
LPFHHSLSLSGIYIHSSEKGILSLDGIALFAADWITENDFGSTNPTEVIFVTDAASFEPDEATPVVNEQKRTNAFVFNI